MPHFLIVKSLSFASLQHMEVLGIDIGGSGMKAAPVDLQTGELMAERFRLPTPDKPKIEPFLETVKALIDHFSWKGSVGCGFPGIIMDGIVHFAPNLHPSLIGLDLAKALVEMGASEASVINDADAAGLAEMRLGAGKEENGLVIVLTVGTGLGSGVFHNGMLLRNCELGHVEWQGNIAEAHVSERTRKNNDMTWKQWGKRFSEYLNYLEFFLCPNLFILGGGGAKKPHKFAEFLQLQTPWKPAHFGNRAGIIGAALSRGAFDEN